MNEFANPILRTNENDLMSFSQQDTHITQTLHEQKPQVHSNVYADLIFGSIAGLTGKLVEYPFDTIKVHMQTQSAKVTTTGTLKHILSEQGIQGLFRGLSAPLIGSMIENSMLFLAYNQAQAVIRSTQGKSPSAHLGISELTLAGAMSGALVSFVLTPVELLKCQMQVLETMSSKRVLNPLSVKSSNLGPAFPFQRLWKDTLSSCDRNQRHHQNGFSRGFRHYYNAPTYCFPGFPSSAIIQDSPKKPASPLSIMVGTLRAQGIAGLYRGHAATMMREIAGGAAWFGTYEFIVSRFLASAQSRSGNYNLTKGDLPAWSLMFAGAMGGIAYNTALFPADVVKARQQTTHQGQSLFKVAKQLYVKEGYRGLYRGYGITLMRSAPTSGIIFLTFEWLNRTFVIE